MLSVHSKWSLMVRTTCPVILSMLMTSTTSGCSIDNASLLPVLLVVKWQAPQLPRSFIIEVFGIHSGRSQLALFKALTVLEVHSERAILIPQRHHRPFLAEVPLHPHDLLIAARQVGDVGERDVV